MDATSTDHPVLQGYMIDPVFLHVGGEIWNKSEIPNEPESPQGWYFWDEEYENYYGPYSSHEEAMKEIQRYAKEILGK